MSTGFVAGIHMDENGRLFGGPAPGTRLYVRGDISESYRRGVAKLVNAYDAENTVHTAKDYAEHLADVFREARELIGMDNVAGKGKGPA